MPTNAERVNFMKRQMQNNTDATYNVIIANTTPQQRAAILAAVTSMSREQEIAQLEAFLPRYVGGDATLYDQIAARLATLKAQS